jgi:hypothetical protein
MFKALALALLLAGAGAPNAALAQTPPTRAELAAYTGLHAAAAQGDLESAPISMLAMATDARRFTSPPFRGAGPQLAS